MALVSDCLVVAAASAVVAVAVAVVRIKPWLNAHILSNSTLLVLLLLLLQFRPLSRLLGVVKNMFAPLSIFLPTKVRTSVILFFFFFDSFSVVLANNPPKL